MPTYAGKVEPEQIDAIVAYLSTPAAGGKDEGETK
jgi:hypothetical protein